MQRFTNPSSEYWVTVEVSIANCDRRIQIISFGTVCRRTIGRTNASISALHGTLHNDIELYGDPCVAAFNSIMIWQDSKLYLVDTLLSAGTLINGRRLTRAEKCALSVGDSIRMGQTVLTILQAGEDGSIGLDSVLERQDEERQSANPERSRRAA